MRNRIEYDLLHKEIRVVQESLAASFDALNKRVARLENQKLPCEDDELIHVTFSRGEARKLWAGIAWSDGLCGQREKLAKSLGIL